MKAYLLDWNTNKRPNVCDTSIGAPRHAAQFRLSVSQMQRPL
jgi:hypothetical protein